MLIVPLSKIKALNWRLEVVPIEDVWEMDHYASGYRLLGLPEPVDLSEPVTLRYFQSHSGATGFIRDDNDTVKAHHIDWGCTGDQVSSAQVPYCNSLTYPTVESALDYLLYVPLTIDSFSNNVGTVEIGSTVSTVGLSWAYNKDVTSQSIDNGIGSLTISLRAYSHSTSFTTDRTYILTASDGTQTPTSTTSVSFRHYRYWGASSSTSLNSSGILGLGALTGEYGGKEFATTQVKGATTDWYIQTSSEYLYYAYPASWGDATFFINGLQNTAFTKTVVAFTNASGNTTNFNVYRSDNKSTGRWKVAVTL